MLTVHHLNNSRSQRVLWLLEELGVPYEIKKYERDRETMLAPPELQKIHPLGKSPVITDGDTTVAESGAILEYLVERYGDGRFAPASGTPEHLTYRYFMHYAEGSLMPYLLLRFIFGRIRVKAPFLIRPVAKKIASSIDEIAVAPNLARHVAFLDGHLAGRTWFAGELSAADAQMLYPMEALAARYDGVPASLTAWVERAHAREAYQRALERGGPYQAA
ncbi:MAG TPA: glutathione S-transferase [Kofleriaceae bacterium]|nr:glutathione S-transferase [Kofleriaceae bacterium]